MLANRFGTEAELGECIVGTNLNLVVFRGYATLDLLAAISGPDVYDSEWNPSGTQRELSATHARSCYVYSSSASSVPALEDPRAFPEIILNARDKQVLEIYNPDDPEDVLDLDSFSDLDEELVSRVVRVRVRIDDLEFPTPVYNPQISRVDGNHRLSGVDVEALIAAEEDTEHAVVPFCLYVNLTTEQEVKLFKDINGEHKGMDVTHLMNIVSRLEGEKLKEDARRRHVWFASELSKPPRSFGNMVFLGGSRAGVKDVHGKVPPVKLNTLASATKLLLSKADLAVAQFGDKPDLLLELMDRYWCAVRDVFPDAWADKRNYILLQTIGLSGFAQLGAWLIDQGITAGKVDVDDFKVFLTAVGAEVDLARDSEQWRGVAGAGGGNRVASELIRAANADAAIKVLVEQQLKPHEDPHQALDE